MRAAYKKLGKGASSCTRKLGLQPPLDSQKFRRVERQLSRRRGWLLVWRVPCSRLNSGSKGALAIHPFLYLDGGDLLPVLAMVHNFPLEFVRKQSGCICVHGIGKYGSRQSVKDKVMFRLVFHLQRLTIHRYKFNPIHN